MRRRGSPEAGAIFIKVDRLDGSAVLIGPAPQSEAQTNGDRQFVRMHQDEAIPSVTVESKLQLEMRFDPDLWIVELEESAGRSFIDLAR